MADAPPETPIIPPHVRDLLPRQEKFCQLVASGEKVSRAYRLAYKRPKATARQANDRVSELMAIPHVRARLHELRSLSQAHTLLTLNERLSLLADAARAPGNSPAHRSATARVIEVYNKTAGDGAPERQEHIIKGDPTAPLHTTGRPATKPEKLAALRALRLARGAAVKATAAPPSTPPAT